MDGVAGFEPAAPSSRTKCATGLRYTPELNWRSVGKSNPSRPVDSGLASPDASRSNLVRSAGIEPAWFPAASSRQCVYRFATSAGIRIGGQCRDRTDVALSRSD